MKTPLARPVYWVVHGRASAHVHVCSYVRESRCAVEERGSGLLIGAADRGIEGEKANLHACLNMNRERQQRFDSLQCCGMRAEAEAAKVISMKLNLRTQ